MATPVSSATERGGMMFRVTVRRPLTRRTLLVSTVSTRRATEDSGTVAPWGVCTGSEGRAARSGSTPALL